MRSLRRSDEIRESLARYADVAGLEFAAADLGEDGGWDEAVAGCHGVLHLASPFPVRSGGRYLGVADCFDPMARQAVPDLGKPFRVDNAATRRALGVTFIPSGEAAAAMGRSLLELDLA